MQSDKPSEKKDYGPQLKQDMIDDALQRLPLARVSDKPSKRRYGKVALKIDIYIERCKKRMVEMKAKIDAFDVKDKC